MALTLIFDADDTLWENNALFERVVEPVPGVDEVLTDLGTRHELRLMTTGDPVEQQAKIAVSGLAGHFRSVHVMGRTDVATYRAPAAELALVPSTTWMIGNSPRFDTLPARAAGLNAVFVPHPHTWEHEEAGVDDPEVLTVGSLRDLPEHF